MKKIKKYQESYEQQNDQLYDQGTFINDKSKNNNTELQKFEENDDDEMLSKNNTKNSLRLSYVGMENNVINKSVINHNTGSSLAQFQQDQLFSSDNN